MIELLSVTHNHSQYFELLSQFTEAPPVTQEQFVSQLSLIQSNPFHKIFVMIQDDVIIGSVTVLIEPKFIRKMSSTAHIEDVVVRDSHRGKGYGKALVNHAIEYAREHGCYKAILDCSSDMVPFYEKVGLTNKGSQMAIYIKPLLA